jgi:YhcG PDDEXK nuclease domain
MAMQIALFERAVLNPVKVSPVARLLQPEISSKLSFYLEALDRDVRKPFENPAIGVLLCASKDDEVVEYALSRTASPALIAQYETQLPDKALLQSKLHEFYLQNICVEPDLA